MKKNSILFAAVMCACAVHAQQNGADILFKNCRAVLSAADKQSIFMQTGFVLSGDTSQPFAQDADSKEYPFSAQVYITDMNKDAQPEVFIIYGNTFTSGNTGSSVILFIKNSSGKYISNLGFPGVEPDVLATSSMGYSDLLIGGPGMAFPVWRWNGKAYVFLKEVKDDDYDKLKKSSLQDAQDMYIKTLP